jgi:hypothetical protein
MASTSSLIRLNDPLDMEVDDINNTNLNIANNAPIDDNQIDIPQSIHMNNLPINVHHSNNNIPVIHIPQNNDIGFDERFDSDVYSSKNRYLAVKYVRV